MTEELQVLRVHEHHGYGQSTQQQEEGTLTVSEIVLGILTIAIIWSPLFFDFQ